MQSAPPTRTAGIAAAVITVLIWTLFIVIARASVQRVLLPLDVAWLRFVGASMLLLPWGWWLNRSGAARGWLGLSPYPWRITLQVGLLGGLGFGLLVYVGFYFAPAAHAAVLMTGSLPLWTTLAAYLMLRERPVPARLAGLALIIAGGLLVGGSSLLDAGAGMWRGDLCFMGAALAWSFYSVVVRRHALDAVGATVAMTVFALAVFVPAYGVLALTGVIPSRLQVAPAGDIVFQMIWQGWISVAVSGSTFMIMVRAFGPVRTTMVTALVPGLAALSAVVWLNEPLGWNLLAGLALVTLGIVFGVRAAAPGARTGADAGGAAQAAPESTR